METSHDIYPGYRILRPLTIFAGVIGVFQSLIWITMTIIGIIAYNCVLDFSDTQVNVATITQLTFYQMYFRGECNNDHLPEIDLSSLNSISTVINPENINVWMYAYLVLSFCWFLSSMSLLNGISKINLKQINLILYIWVFITLALTALDLAFGIMFGLDFKKYFDKSYDIQFSNLTLAPFALISAQISSITMMIMSLRGFILWIINLCLLIYFFTETFIINQISSSSPSTRTAYDNNAYVTDIHSILNRNPINAYGGSSTSSNKGLQLNVAPLERAHMMAINSMQERAKRLQENPDRVASKTGESSILRYNNKGEIYIPNPDYSPYMSRASSQKPPQLKSALKNGRFQ